MSAEQPLPQDFSLALEGQERSFFRAVPFYLAVPLVFWAGYRWFGVPLHWPLVGIGALGWWLALVLRAPVVLAARRLPEAHAKWGVVGASGPLEEGVRVAAVLILAPGLAGALSLGLGWAAIEVIFTVVNGLLVVRLLRKDDDRAREVRALLEDQGTLSASAPWLGVVERIFASLLHVGFTLMLAAEPLLALAAAPLHSGVNVLAARLSRRLGLVLAVLAVAGVAAVACGLALFGSQP